MTKSLTEAAKAILEGANAETLKPKSGPAMPPESLGSATTIADAPKKPGDGTNVGAAAAAPIGKDKSKPTSGAKAPDPEQHLEEEEEVDGEEINEDEYVTEEEIEAYIDALVAEGYDEDEIAAALEENFDLIGEEEEELEEAKKKAKFNDTRPPKVNDDDDEKAYKRAQGSDLSEDHVEDSYSVDMTEHVNALLEGESLSEEFKTKATTIFEAAVKTKLEEEVALMEEAYASALEENVNDLMEELTASVDDYLNYVVEQWLQDNEIAVEAGLRTELTEDFISGLRQLFAENYIDIPEDKVSVVEELGDRVEELEAKLNEEIDRNVELVKVLNENNKQLVVMDMLEGLTSAQAEKLKELVETVEYTDEEEFTDKVKTLRESYFPTNGVKAQKELDSVEAGSEGKSMIQEELNGPMARYVQTLGKKLPN